MHQRVFGVRLAFTLLLTLSAEPGSGAGPRSTPCAARRRAAALRAGSRHSADDCPQVTQVTLSAIVCADGRCC